MIIIAINSKTQTECKISGTPTIIILQDNITSSNSLMENLRKNGARHIFNRISSFDLFLGVEESQYQVKLIKEDSKQDEFCFMTVSFAYPRAELKTTLKDCNTTSYYLSTDSYECNDVQVCI
jgi:glycerol-3-phosphate responsive antiterminator